MNYLLIIGGGRIECKRFAFVGRYSCQYRYSKKRVEIPINSNRGGTIIAYYPIEYMQVYIYDIKSNQIPDMLNLGFRMAYSGSYFRILACRHGRGEFVDNRIDTNLSGGEFSFKYVQKAENRFLFTADSLIGVEVVLQLDYASNESFLIRLLKIKSEETIDSSDKEISTNPSAASNTTVSFKGYNFMGYISIPKFKLNLPVMSDWNYDKLNVSPCKYTGSVLTDDLVVAAHNYNSHFGKIFQLEKSDEVVFTDMSGNTYLYEVVLTNTLTPVEITKMTSGEYDLSLFTCTWSGTARVTVRCNRKYIN